jgi:hypothetical protein
VGANLTVTGCSDSSFNVVSNLVLAADYPNSLEEVYEPGSTSTATGCTISGFNEDSFETVAVTAVSGSNLTATFAHVHAASDLWGMVAVAFAPGTFGQHRIEGLGVGFCKGACLYMDNNAEVYLSGFAAGYSASMTSVGIEADGTWQGAWDNIFSQATIQGSCHANCSESSYPYAIHFSQDAARNNGIGGPAISITNSTLLGGIKVDGNGMDDNAGAGAEVGPIISTVFEQNTGAGVMVDTRHSLGGTFTVNMDFAGNQDNFLGNPQYYVGATDCCMFGTENAGNGDVGFANLGTLMSYPQGSLSNPYWKGGIRADNVQPQYPNPASTGDSSGSLSNGDAFMGSFRGENAGMSPSLVPYPTLAVSAITCGTCSTVTGPDGVSGSASEIQGNGSEVSVTVGTKTGSTYAGDYIIFGVRGVKPGTNSTSLGGSYNGPFFVQTGGTDTFVNGAGGHTDVRVGNCILPLSNDSWCPGIQIATLAIGETTSHTLSFILQSGATTAGAGQDFYDPFWIYVPGPNNPAYTGVTRQEVVRWAEDLMRGYTPSSGSTGVLYMSPSHKLSWGTQTDLYSGPNNNVKTDQAFDAVNGYRCNGSYGVSGQFLSTTGSGCQWGNPTASLPAAPSWLLFQGTAGEGAYNCGSGSCTLNGEHQYSSVNISSGATVDNNINSWPLIIRSTGTCTIAGTISASANSGGMGVYNLTSLGSTGGGGGGGTAAGAAAPTISSYLASGGSAGAASGGTGGAGNSLPLQLQQLITNNGALTGQYSNEPYGGGQGGNGGSSGGSGGKGGGMVVLDCQTINFTGTIDASGVAGGASTGNNIGAGGGGAGGIVILRSPNLTNSGTINVSGGAGGSCGAFTGCGAGGAGAGGWSAVFSQ